MSSECSSGNIPPGYKQTEVGVIPEDWDVEPLRCDVTLLSGRHVLAQHCNTSGDGVPYLTGPADFPNNKIQQTKFTNRPTTLCEAGDILVTVKGSGSGTLVEADDSYCISRQLMAIRVKEWNAKFLFYSILYNASQIKTSSTGLIPGLSRLDILDQIIPLPPTLSEQESIAEALSDADSFIESLEQLIAKKRQIKQGAMQELLTGKGRLPGFEVKKGYKQTEVGLIPEDWEVKPLHALADKIMVGIASAATHAYRDRGIVMFRNQNIKPNYLDDSDVLYLAEDYEANFRNKRLRSGDLLTARTGYPGTTSIVPNNYEGSQSFTTLITRPLRDIVDSTYLCYFINSEAGQSYFEQNQIGGGQKNVNAGSLKYLPVTLPPTKAEQEAIASILSDMDSEITALEEKLAKARQIKQGMMQELLTGRIRLI